MASLAAYLAANYGPNASGKEPDEGRQRRKKKVKRAKVVQGLRIRDADVDALPSSERQVIEDDPVLVDEQGREISLTINEQQILQSEHLGPSAASTADASPPRRQRHDSPDASPPRRQRHDSPDASPPRRQRHDSPDASPPRRQRHDSPDASPPRRQRTGGTDASPPRRSRTASKRSASLTDQSHEDASPPRRRAANTSDIEAQLQNLAGLQNAAALRQDLELRAAAEQRMLDALGDSAGHGQETVHRDKSGRRLDPKLERLRKREMEQKREELEQEQMEWGRGLKQTRDAQDRRAEIEHEMSKPLARSRNDEDLNKMQRDEIRAEDPMAAYIMKQREQASGKPSRPRYRGPPAPPNRFGIEPGHRWDGRDRSNGFEQRWFQTRARGAAVGKDAYKWSVEDM